MNSRWLNRMVLGLAVPGLAAGAWGTASLLTRMSAVETSAASPFPIRPLGPGGELVALKAIERSKSHSEGNIEGGLETLAQKAWGDEWEKLRAKIQDLSDKANSGESATTAKWIECIRDEQEHTLMVKLRGDLGLVDHPGEDELESLAKRISLLLGDTDENLAAVTEIRVKLLDEFKTELPQPGSALAAPDAKSESDRTFSAAGIDFVWITEGEFWISKDEVMEGSKSLPNIASVADRLKDDGIPEAWIALPNLTQWQLSKKAAPSLGLMNFDKGQGEFLSDDTIIGEAEGFKNSKSVGNQALRLEARVDKTRERLLVAPATVASPGRSTGTPAKYSNTNEQNFATRIVINPER
jgi:hypothetical protein